MCFPPMALINRNYCRIIKYHPVTMRSDTFTSCIRLKIVSFGCHIVNIIHFKLMHKLAKTQNVPTFPLEMTGILVLT